MPRDDGFAVADTATGKLNDPKFRKLWRLVQDEAAMNAAVVLHDATLLASWAAGERVPAEDAAPMWIADVPTAISNLQSVTLLDSQGRIPLKSWQSWFGVAYARRQKRRDAGLLGGRPPKASEPESEPEPETEPEPSPNQMVSDEEPSGYQPETHGIATDNPVPSVPSVPLRSGPSEAAPSVAVGKPRASGPTNEPRLTEAQLRSWENFGPKWSRFKEAWLGRGLLYAPFGSPDDNDSSQRGLLHSVLDARPNDIVQWVKDAPLPSSREVITYILERWHEVREDAGVDDDEWEEQKLEERRTATGSLTRISDALRRSA